jgi:hypothetical protein
MQFFQPVTRVAAGLALASTLLLTACGITPLAEELVEKPSQPTTAVRVLYIDSRLGAGKEGLSAEAVSTLDRVDYFTLGEKIKRLAPEILAKRGLWADALSMKEEVFVKNGYKKVTSNYSAKKPLRLLFIYFKNGPNTDYEALNAGLNLQVLFRDMKTNTLYWKGEYRYPLKQLPFGGPNLDDKFVKDMLQQIFADMEKSDLLPPATTNKAQ